jgi:hypothetical protein
MVDLGEGREASGEKAWPVRAGELQRLRREAARLETLARGVTDGMLAERFRQMAQRLEERIARLSRDCA